MEKTLPVDIDRMYLGSGLAVSTFEAVARSLWRETAADLTAVLDERKREILKLWFGLDGGERRTLEEVGEHFNLTREQIRQLESQALDTIRTSLMRGSEDAVVVVLDSKAP